MSRKLRTNRPALALVLIACVVLSAMTAASPAGAQDDRSARSRLGLVQTGPGRFSIDVQGADIHTVLRAVAEFSGKNIVAGSAVKGQISITLHDMPWRDALTTITRANGLDFTEEAGAIRVDTADKLQAELLARETNEARRLEVQPLDTRIVHLNYAAARELQPVLQSTLSKRGTIQVDERTNSIVVTDVTDNVDDIEKMAIKLDSETPQIEITSKLVDVDVSALRDLGIEWNITADLGQTGATNQKILIDLPAQPPAGTLKIGTVNAQGSFEATISALEQHRKANIISNPRITTVDNRQAKILVGQKIPLIVQDVAGNAVTQLQTIGIQLTVTPHLTADKRIVLDLHPEVSDLSTQSTVQGGVIINTSEADTRVMVDNGQTAVIGGLIRNDDSRVRTGIPILMHIPLLGQLFENDTVVKSQRELVIFVTPKLLASS
ncbi:MAG TPA: secretin N-terminal domain-containing protein [Candidatus Eisenbacteria bacterium]|nr:secretin N-terminal domain-containing protein [Candidatus Eisenbacteria bacterium]